MPRQIDRTEKTVPRAALQKLARIDLSSAEKECLTGLLSNVGKAAEQAGEIADREGFYRRLAGLLANDASLLSCLRQPTAELDALRRISVNLTASLQLQTVLDGVVSEALGLVKNANDANIFLYTDGRLTFGAALDAQGNRDATFAEPRPNGLTYSVAREKRMIVVEDMRSHSIFADAPAEWSGSIVGIPLTIESRVVGVMNLARSTEGAFSPSEIRLLTLLADQAAIAIVNARLHHAVSQLARIDGLTGLPNRRSLDEHLEQEINRARVTDASFSVIMLDVDGFKTINDIHGHEAGDDILKQVAAALVHALRSTDFLARYGGDELTLILPETDLPQAQVVADKIHARMQSLVLRLPGKQTTNLGISGGIAMYPRHGDSATSLLRAADEALYRAKRSGRNRSMVAADA